MADSFNPEMLTLVRESCRLTQSALSKATGIAQGTISKLENGQGAASPDLLSKLATALGYEASIFSEPYVPSPIFRHRKRQALSVTDFKAISGTITIIRMQIRKLLKSVDLPKNRVPEYHIERDKILPWEVAREVRAQWGLPSGRVDNLSAILESAGVIVVKFNFGSHLIDGASAFDPTDPSMPPIIFLNSMSPAERTRFTAAHELGHIVLHYHHGYTAGEDCEDEANDFASEFLMPTADIKGFLGGLSLDVLASLKPRWKVSMASLLYRAERLGKISPYQSRNLWIQMARHGYKTREPMELPPEETTVLRDIFRVHTDQLGYSEQDLAKAIHLQDLAKAVHLPVESYLEKTKVEQPKLRLLPAH